jgi:hypothetical protein
LLVAEAIRAVPTIGATAARTPRTCRIDLEVTRSLEIECTRNRRCVDRDQRGDTHQHQRLRIEARRLDHALSTGLRKGCDARFVPDLPTATNAQACAKIRTSH